MKKGKTFRKHLISVFTAMLLGAGSIMPVSAAETEPFEYQTKNTVVDAADHYVIAKDSAGKMGLLDEEGEEAIPFEYDEMYFPEETDVYDYVIVKQRETWGILNYDGEELVEVRYDKYYPYENENTVAGGFDGNKTHIYNLKGKEIGTLEGDCSVISDTYFKGTDSLKNEKDKNILKYEKEGLVNPEDDSVNVLKIGEYVAFDYFFTGSEDEKVPIGNLKVDRYVKVYDQEGNVIADIKPVRDWTSDSDDGNYQSGGVRMVKVISDSTLLVQMTGFDDKYLIYDLNEQKYSEKKFNNIGEFRNGKAVALDEDDEVQLINELGEVQNTDKIEIDGYKKRFKDSKEAAYLLFKKKNQEEYKLYSLNQQEEMSSVYKEVIFRGQYTILENMDENYGVIDEDGETIIPFNTFEREEIVNAYYTDESISVCKKDGETTYVHIYPTSEQQKGMDLPTWAIILIVVAVVVVVVVIVFLTLHSKKKKRLEEEEKERKRQEEMRRNAEKRKEQERREREALYANHRKEMNPKPAVKPAFSGVIKGVTGEYAGAEIVIRPGDKIRIGRSNDGNDLILNNTKVSRHHCVITYDEFRGKYMVMDLSSNGVYYNHGIRLQKGINTPLDGGTVLYIGNEENAFELKRDLGRNR
ncbi:MAG: FHA domain-containing protein [Lachnospiraceae bacterium]|nr:FHA domain-containing protein [Lachnospiraceae bacterium]